jgi:phenylacetate-CoA ligase
MTTPKHESIRLAAGSPSSSYTLATREYRDGLRRAPREQLVAHQVQRLNRILAEAVARDGFYRRKYHADALRVTEVEDLRRLPLLTKNEIDSGDGTPAKFHTFGPDAYVRFHRTSGTKGNPLPVMDTASDWHWWIETWQYVLDTADVMAKDIAFMAFSFGPFIGFWSAHDALTARGCMVVPGGGLSTRARLGLIESSRATILCCTPTYALHLAETAIEAGLDPRSWHVSKVIVAGEPGGSIPEVRHKIELLWGARVIDHSGATEIGPWGVGSRDGRGLHVVESEFIAELLKPGTDRPAKEGELAELVLTGLGRFGAPAIRYRTGDLVRGYRDHDPDCRFLWLAGGILGRADDMMVIRGVNVFPSSIESIVRSFPRLGEFRIVASRCGELDELSLVVEDPDENANEIAQAMEQRLGLRITVTTVKPHVLPRFEGKANRFDDQRSRRSPS